MNHPSEYTELHQDVIQASLTTKAFGRTLRILPEVSSTNSYALTLAESHAAHGTVVVAERQTGGRGRLNRAWFSPPGLNLYFSVMLIPDGSSPPMTWIPLIAGLAMTDALRHTCGVHATLKWPNDVLLNEKKVGGILCEGTSQGHHKRFVVVGMGLNVNMFETDFPDNLRPHSTSLRLHTQSPTDRNRLLARLLNALESWYTQLIEGPIDPIRAAYAGQCKTLGRELLVHLTNGETFGAVGHAIGEDGSLHVCLQNSPGTPVRVIHSGDVTHIKNI